MRFDLSVLTIEHVFLQMLRGHGLSATFLNLVLDELWLDLLHGVRLIGLHILGDRGCLRVENF
jgi:hypothetical protein